MAVPMDTADSRAELAAPIKTVEEKWRLLPSFLRVGPPPSHLSSLTL